MKLSYHCGACGRALKLARKIWFHVLEGWDKDYRPHVSEPVPDAAGVR